MQSLSKSDEQQLLDGVKMAVDLVDGQGLSPNEALQKVAQTFHYSPGYGHDDCAEYSLSAGKEGCGVLRQWPCCFGLCWRLGDSPVG